MELKNVVLEKRENIGIITMNRPSVLNAINTETLLDLQKVISCVEKDDDIYVLIITGAGKAFVAGADINEMKDMTTIEGRKFSILGNEIFRKLEILEKPVIAAVNGFAIGGGCELSMACDIRISSSKAKFAQSEVALGITPGFGGTQRLARYIGLGKAKELMFTGRFFSAEEALHMGLVNAVYEPEELMDEAIKLAESIAKNAPIAVKLCKEAINRGMQMDMDTAIKYESEIFGECFSTEDQKEGMNAFVEKRNKNFKNK
ncbi:short-chain-enoyl-CoA hydratase [Haloimpatiens lingqiaonensis]|uniref:short-chain-enoyl-CoA hydratase n=1 Tax=Haloimpatiens lingqiaonensis TaxID=1380675 RepID=UPI0010FD9E69|nr:short-chain-enoyl-CoA hydratase [Haloimpatiens lingqiaonensis]